MVRKGPPSLPDKRREGMHLPLFPTPPAPSITSLYSRESPAAPPQPPAGRAPGSIVLAETPAATDRPLQTKQRGDAGILPGLFPWVSGSGEGRELRKERHGHRLPRTGPWTGIEPGPFGPGDADAEPKQPGPKEESTWPRTATSGDSPRRRRPTGLGPAPRPPRSVPGPGTPPHLPSGAHPRHKTVFQKEKTRHKGSETLFRLRSAQEGGGAGRSSPGSGTRGGAARPPGSPPPGPRRRQAPRPSAPRNRPLYLPGGEDRVGERPRSCGPALAATLRLWPVTPPAAGKMAP